MALKAAPGRHLFLVGLSMSSRWASISTALLVAILATYMALFVTPLGDTPDESGHYSYVHDIANGTVFPLFGEAKMTSGRWGYDVERWGEDTRGNYMAQHPPLYYAVAAIPYALADRLTEGNWWKSRAPRLVSALSLGLLVLVLFKNLTLIGLDAPRAAIGSVAITLVPNLLHLSSGTTNDVFLLLLCAIATLYFTQFILRHQISAAYWCAFWLTLAGITKMTAWVLIAPFVAIMVFELRGPFKHWLTHSVGISLLALAGPLWWMGRSFYHHGSPFYRSGSEVDPRAGLGSGSFTELLGDWPVMEWLFGHFLGLIGFSGYCVTPELREFCTGIRMTQIYGFSREAFTWVLLGTLIIFALFLLVLVYQALRRKTRNEPAWGVSVQSFIAVRLPLLPLKWGLLGALLIGGTAYSVIIFTSSNMPAQPNGLLQLLGMSAPPMLTALALGLLFFPQQATSRLALYAPVIFLFFGSMLLYQIYIGYLILGYPSATQGRYLFPILPLLVVAFGVAVQALKVPRWVLAVGFVLLLFGLANAYLDQIIPFYIESQV